MGDGEEDAWGVDTQGVVGSGSQGPLEKSQPQLLRTRGDNLGILLTCCPPLGAEHAPVLVMLIPRERQIPPSCRKLQPGEITRIQTQETRNPPRSDLGATGGDMKLQVPSC